MKRSFSIQPNLERSEKRKFCMCFDQIKKWPAQCVSRLVAASIVTLGISAWAEPFVYTPRDLLLGFRQVGGVYELMVNVGPSSNYFNATPGSSLVVTGFNATQLNFMTASNLNNLLWSVSGGVKSGDGGDPAIPATTLWMTRARANSQTQSVAWTRASSFSQGGCANRVASMGAAAATVSNNKPADPVENTRSAVIEPGGSTDSYSFFVSSGGNFLGTFSGNVENNTGSDFIAPVRSDFYEMRPGTGPGRYLGYFELRLDGTMIFQAPAIVSPPGPPRPIIQAITSVGDTHSISFTTTNDATVIYRLCFTNDAGLGTSITNWPKGAGAITGNGSVRTLQDTTTEGNRFYGVTATR